MTEPTTPKRKRGGQPGNLNALKHGFYSRQFRHLELEDLRSLLSPGLVDEVAMLRVMTRRVLELADGIDEVDAAAGVLASLGGACSRLANLLRTEKFLTGSADGGTARAISQALNEVMQELKGG